MSNPLYSVQYAAPQHNPPAYEDVELSDYEMAGLLNDVPVQANPNHVYYNPVAATNSQIVSIPTVPVGNVAYVPNYATPVVVNGSVIVQQPQVQSGNRNIVQVVAVPNQNVSVCHRRGWGGCRSNLSPQEYRVHCSANFLKFHLFMLLILAVIFYFFVRGFPVVMILSAHVVMLILGIIASSKRNVPILALLFIWLILTLVGSCLLLAAIIPFATCGYYILLGSDIFFMFFGICNTISLIVKIRCRRCAVQTVVQN